MGNDKKERSTGVGVQIDAPTPTPDKMIRQQDGGVTSLKLPHPLTLEEKKYLLAVERGDFGNVRRILQKAHRKQHININCMDPLGRRALTLAIDGENLEMVELLIVMGVETKDALLQAINAEFVEAVELLLEHEELIHNEGEPYSWQKVDINTAMFTPDITPLILAAHRNNFEILKILLDRGAAVPIPHDIKCGCEECIRLSTEDSLRHSLSRVNVYRALASPSLIALTSSDPLLTAFQLSWELRNLAFTEQECKAEYLELRRQCQKFAVDLLDQTRNSQELAIVLNYDPSSPPYVDGDRMTLARLELAIKYKQKKFVAHPNIQQLLAAMWYEGVPGFRRKTNMEKLFTIIQVAVLFPFYCLTYMLMPGWGISRLMRKPFMKFLIHASSYLFFLFILILVSQRAEDNVIQMFGTENMKRILKERMQKQRGNGPTGLELIVVLYVLGFIWEEVQEIYTVGIKKYLRNMWNFIDFTRNGLYISVCCLRIFAYIQQQNEINKDPSTAYIPREQWHDFDPQLIAEGLFAAANIFSALKLVHLFSINPHLGPLQISLGRMVIDIVKFFFIYSLVLFSFACGLNQLLWYFADLEKQKCYILPGNQADWANNGDSCMKWRRFGNLFESSQSLFWASFGMVGLDAFELTGIKSYTRFWGLLMFGSYSVINVIVLLNLLIAMMSNSYAMIDQHSDTEWKFARTKLWMSYFEDSATLPSPFNILPSMKWIIRIFRRSRKEQRKRMSMKKQEAERENRYINIMRALVWRYVSSQHRKYEEQPVTEDDIYEVKGEISSMRYEMLEIFGRNGMDVSSAAKKEKPARAKRNKTWERRLMKDFQVTPVPQTSETGVGTNNADDDDDKGDPDQITSISTGPPPINEDPKSKFRRIARQIANDSVSHKWNEVLRGVSKNSQIGRCNNKQSYENQQNLQKAIEEAKRLILMSPPPRSSTMSPVEFVDDTSETLLELLNKISEEVSSKCKSTPSQFLSNNNNNSKNKNNNANIIKPIPTKPSVSTSTATIATITSTASTKTENDTINNNSNDSNISKSCISNEARPISPPPMFSNKSTNLAASSSSTTTTISKQQLLSKGNDTTGRQTNTSILSETPIIKITSIDSNNQTVQSATNTHLPTIKPPPPGKPTKKAPPPPPSIPLHERQSFVNNRPSSATGVGGSTTNISSLQASQTTAATASSSSSSSYLRRSPTISLRKCDSVPETFDPPITFLSLNDSTEELVPRSYSPDSDTSTLPPTSPRLKERMPDISMVKRKAGWL